MRVLTLSCSLNPDSRSARLAAYAACSIRSADPAAEVETIDLRDVPLPLCDGNSAYAAPGVSVLCEAITAADAVLLALPIYNYDANAAAKNLIELTGKAWVGKTVGFLCAAGGQVSYMSVLGLANSMMLDFRCLIVPRFVYAVDQADGNETVDEQAQARIDQLVAETLRIAGALATHAPAMAGPQDG